MMFSLFFAVSAIFKDTSDDDEWKRRFGRDTVDMAQTVEPLDLLRAGVNPTVVLLQDYISFQKDRMNTLLRAA